MKKWTIAISTVLLAIALIATLSLVWQSKATSTVEATPPNRTELIQLLNAERAKVSAPPVALDDRLNQSAQRKANQLLKSGVFSHYDENGVLGVEYKYETGIRCKAGVGGENLTQNTIVNDSYHAIKAFMNSKPHREAMLYEGIDYADFGISGNYVVLHMCDEVTR